MATRIFSLTGYAHLYRSLLRFTDLSVNEARVLVYRLNTANLDSARYTNPLMYVIEAEPYAFCRNIDSLECRPYHTEVQLYKALCTLETNIVWDAITEEQRRTLTKMRRIMRSLQARFINAYGVEIYDTPTVYEQCVFGLQPNENEPFVCMVEEWQMLKGA